jgi:hypothetical protein
MTMADKIFLHINDTETTVNKKFSTMKACKAWLAKMPGLLPKRTRKPWLNLTQQHYESLAEGEVLLVSLTPAGTSYTSLPADQMAKAIR